MTNALIADTPTTKACVLQRTAPPATAKPSSTYGCVGLKWRSSASDYCTDPPVMVRPVIVAGIVDPYPKHPTLFCDATMESINIYGVPV